jgi:hypothetical protein
MTHGLERSAGFVFAHSEQIAYRVGLCVPLWALQHLDHDANPTVNVHNP